MRTGATNCARSNQQFLGLQCGYFVAVECCDDVEARSISAKPATLSGQVYRGAFPMLRPEYIENKLDAFIERRAVAAYLSYL
jgi:hypothetical protein